VETERRAATDEEARAIASPLRLRILRLCLDRPLTNKQIAQVLGRDPASVLYHVRTLVRTGFLVAEGERRGARGAREVPYRATGKSWVLDVGD
jgi:predicted ArsR family transcriptional regulator